MQMETATPLDSLLSEIVTALDIPDQVYEDATLKYEALCAWLGASESSIKDLSPELYPQGSFRLGTAVRCVDGDDQHDIDLVCRVDLRKDQTTQKNLFDLIGDCLKQRGDLAGILKPRRRCWRLTFPASGSIPSLYLDVLPSIPNQERLPTGILLTDKELIRWQKSNPKAYAGWFIGRMKVAYDAQKALLAKSLGESIEDVPEWRVKTPLQRVVQILKRHRDVYFKGQEENKPVSIIITTLAAQAYEGQANIHDALVGIVRTMPNYIERRNQKLWVVNPVEEDENFADKWNESPERWEEFERWMRQAQTDLLSLRKLPSKEPSIHLRRVLGLASSVKASPIVGANGFAAIAATSEQQLQVPGLGDTSHCLPMLWRLQERYKARIVGSVHQKASHAKLWEFTDRPVPKEMRLRFEVETNTPYPYEVRWQIVNTGREAAEAHQLRGDFEESELTNPNVRWESTLFRGTHWIQAFIIRDGDCIARSPRRIVKVR